MSESNGKPRGLLPAHERHLAGSGLPPEYLHSLGWFSVTDPEEARRILGWDYPPKPGELLPAIAIPFVNPDGTDAEYVRLRPDNPRVGENGKPYKYESPLGRPGRAYLPPFTRSVRANPTQDLVITEGEKKAAAADLNGIACIGLVGVWNWKKPEQEGGEDADELIDDLAAFEWQGRRVAITFDSDILVKPQVQIAQHRLYEALKAKGAKVVAVYLPQPGPAKVGLDDFLLRHSPDALRDLIRDAIPPPRAEPEGELRNWFRVWFEDASEETDLAKSAPVIVRTMLGYCGGWPKAVGRQLVVPTGGGQPVILKKPAELTAFVNNALADGYGGAKARVRLKRDKNGEGFVGESGIFAAAPDLVERFDDTSRFPHEPPVPGVCYLPFRVEGGSGADLDRLLAEFCPLTPVDASLIRAYWLTLFWGGPGGRRPMFLFTGPPDDEAGGRGVGKSTVPELAALLLGGSIEISQEAGTIDEIKRRMLSGDSAGLRLLRLDNLKTHRFSWGEMEGLITQDRISGHRMYHGHAMRPNLFTYSVTLNGASLSTDIAQRVGPIRIARPIKYSAEWRPRVEALIRDRGRHIIGDILAALKKPAAPLEASNYSRWGEWEAGVLSRVPDPELCRETIAARQMEFNADAGQRDRIRQQFAHVIAQLDLDPDAAAVRFTTPAMSEVYRLATNTTKDATAILNELQLFGLKEIREARSGEYGRCWGWVGAKYKARGTRVFYAAVVDFNPKDRFVMVGSAAEVTE